MLTQRLVAAGGVASSLEEVTAKFEELYQGTASTPGLYLKERLIVPKVRKHVAKQAMASTCCAGVECYPNPIPPPH